MRWEVYDTYFLVVIVIGIVCYWLFKINLSIAAGYFLYGITLAALNQLWHISGLALDAYDATKKIDLPKPKALLPPPTRIIDYGDYYHLHGAEAIQGFYRNRPVKVDFANGHSLISGSTDSGKTWGIHALLMQWFGKGVRFTDNYKVYVIDLKGFPDDLLALWKPVLAGYAQIENGKIDQAIRLMEEVIDLIQSNPDGKRVIMVIDEIANLTKWTGEKEGAAYLEQLASQLRVVGTIIGSVQMGRHDIISTPARTQFKRRICYAARELSHVRLAMASSEIKQGQIPKEKGEFIMFDTDSWSLQRGQVPFMDLHGEQKVEIYQAIDKVLESESETDNRLKLYVTVAANKGVNAQVPGIDGVSRELDWINKLHIQYYYRNFLMAGAFKRGANNAHYMAVEWREGYAMIKDWIRHENRVGPDGQPTGWSHEPPKRSRR